MITKQPSEITVITKSKDLCSYIMTVTQKSPKHFRYTFVNRLQNLSLDIVEKLIRANEIYVVNGNKTYYNQRLNLQRDAMTDLKLLMYFSELSMNQGVILMKQYRLIKEKLQVKYYSRYMDDGVLIHYDKNFLRECLAVMQEHVETDLHLQFNKKTHIAPLANGIDYLGWHFYMTDTGKVVRKLRSVAKNRYKRKLKYMKYLYGEGRMNLDEITPVIRSYHAHFAHGNAYRLEKRVLQDFVLRRE